MFFSRCFPNIKIKILSFVIRDYSCYTWNIRSLSLLVSFSNSDKDITVDDVRKAIAEEMDGPGKLLGYRTMHHAEKDSTGT